MVLALVPHRPQVAQPTSRRGGFCSWHGVGVRPWKPSHCPRPGQVLVGPVLQTRAPARPSLLPDVVLACHYAAAGNLDAFVTHATRFFSVALLAGVVFALAMSRASTRGGGSGWPNRGGHGGRWSTRTDARRRGQAIVDVRCVCGGSRGSGRRHGRCRGSQLYGGGLGAARCAGRRGLGASDAQQA